MRRSAIATAFVLIATLAAAPGTLGQGRLALVIGNSAYGNAPALANPANDAAAVAQVLRGVGFDVIVGLDLSKTTMEQKVQEFSKALRNAETGLFYFAGHGFQAEGRNYLVPIDARLNDELAIDRETLGVDAILEGMQRNRSGKVNIVILDACRDNPLLEQLDQQMNVRSLGARSMKLRSGLAEVRASINTLIAFATQPGNTAVDGQGSNSPFTASLVRHIQKDDRNINAILNEVRKDVVAATRSIQVPWDHSSLLGEFFFWHYGVPASPEMERTRVSAFTWRTTPTEVTPGLRFWTREADGTWLEKYPNGHAQKMQTRARIMLEGCSGTVVGPPTEPNFAVFIPDKGCRAMVARWQRGRGTHWNVLATMENVR